MPTEPSRSPLCRAFVLAAAGIALLLAGILVGRWLATVL